MINVSEIKVGEDTGRWVEALAVANKFYNVVRSAIAKSNKDVLLGVSEEQFEKLFVQMWAFLQDSFTQSIICNDTPTEAAEEN